MRQVLELLDIPLLQYNPEDDPMMLTQLMMKNHTSEGESQAKHKSFEPIEWTIPEEWVKDKDLAQKVKEKKVIKTNTKRQKKSEENTEGDNIIVENRKKQKVSEVCNSEVISNKQADDNKLSNEEKVELKHELSLTTEKHITDKTEFNNGGKYEICDAKNEVPLMDKKYEKIEKGIDNKIKDDIESIQNGKTDCDYKNSTNVLDALGSAEGEEDGKKLPVKSEPQETSNKLG